MPDPLASLAVGVALLAAACLLFWPNKGLVVRLSSARRSSMRVLREDALKHICVAEHEGFCPTLDSIAGALRIPSSRAAVVIEDLERHELVTSRGERMCLTPAGRDLGLHVLRAHRLWEQHLAEYTGYDEAEWHAQAEHHEHRLSPKETEALEVRLGRPLRDPHGDPIPTTSGANVVHRGHRLTAMAINQPLRVVHVEDEPGPAYAQLIAEGVYPGMLVRLLEVSPLRVRFWADGNEHVLAPIVAAQVSVVPELGEASQAGIRTEALSVLRPGEHATVSTISPRCHGPARWRLMDLGILPGTKIAAELSGPAGDPVAYRVRETLIALRRDQAQMIRITRQPEATP